MRAISFREESFVIMENQKPERLPLHMIKIDYCVTNSEIKFHSQFRIRMKIDKKILKNKKEVRKQNIKDLSKQVILFMGNFLVFFP